MWDPSIFLIASPSGPVERDGYVYRGMSLHMVKGPSPKGRRPPWWALSHIGSGHRICVITGFISAACLIASEIAECGDWSFDGLDGWKNIDPELKAKTFAIMDKYPKWVDYSKNPGRQAMSEDVARAIVMARN